MKKREQKDFFKKTLPICLLIIGFGIYLVIRGSKEKTDFNTITGQIDYFDKTFEERNYRNKGDHRFIHIVDFPLVFDIFVGKASGDFGPKYEQLDKLRLGDEITVYYDDKTPLQNNQELRFNKTGQFIDKKGEAYFIRGNKDKYGGYLFIGIVALLAISLLVLKKLGKIT